MLFSSSVFIFCFLPVVLLGFQLFSRYGRVALFSWLSAASYFFYAYWNPRYLILLVASILLNFCFSRLIVRANRQNHVLALAIAANLSILVWFKYLFPALNFFSGAGLFDHHWQNVVLPLGISFFTFTQIAYLIDLKQGVAEKQDLVSYSLFVSFFPHLIAGPIIHHSEMMPQFAAQRTRGLRVDDVALGWTWFVLGLAKKVLIADRIAPLADGLYDRPHAFGFMATWLGVLAYAMQLYFDFSGYSDMALGLARMFSIRFPFNFNSPYKATNIIDFWQRWHMTLTRYLTLYLYNPIAMQVTRRRIAAGKKTSKKASRTLNGFFEMICWPVTFTMFLAGVWHGAGLQFIVFGMLHAFYLSVNHAWRVFVPAESRWQKLLPAPVGVVITFLAVLVGQIYFRAANCSDAAWVMGSLCRLHGKGPTLAQAAESVSYRFPNIMTHWLTSPLPTAAFLVICFLIVWTMPNTQEILGQVPDSETRTAPLLGLISWRPSLAWATCTGLVLLCALVVLDSSSTFLYFQF